MSPQVHGLGQPDGPGTDPERDQDRGDDPALPPAAPGDGGGPVAQRRRQVLDLLGRARPQQGRRDRDVVLAVPAVAHRGGQQAAPGVVEDVRRREGQPGALGEDAQPGAQ